MKPPVAIIVLAAFTSIAFDPLLVAHAHHLAVLDEQVGHLGIPTRIHAELVEHTLQRLGALRPTGGINVTATVQHKRVLIGALESEHEGHAALDHKIDALAGSRQHVAQQRRVGLVVGARPNEIEHVLHGEVVRLGQLGGRLDGPHAGHHCGIRGAHRGRAIEANDLRTFLCRGRRRHKTARAQAHHDHSAAFLSVGRRKLLGQWIIAGRLGSCGAVRLRSAAGKPQSGQSRGPKSPKPQERAARHAAVSDFHLLRHILLLHGNPPCSSLVSLSRSIRTSSPLASQTLRSAPQEVFVAMLGQPNPSILHEIASCKLRSRMGLLRL